MSEKKLEKSEMSSVDFASYALKNHIAPPGSAASVGARIRKASRTLGWSFTRTKDAWYADPRISISAEELREIEETSGITYGKREARELDAAVKRASEILVELQKDSPRSLAHAVIEAVRILAGTGTKG